MAPRSNAHKALPFPPLIFTMMSSITALQFLQCGPLYQVLKTWTYNFHFVRVFEHPHVKNTNVFSAIKNGTQQTKPTQLGVQPTPRGTQSNPSTPSPASVVASEAPSLKASEAFLVAGWAAMAAA